MRSAGGLSRGMLVLPRSTPLRPVCFRYFVTGTSGGHTSRMGDEDRPEAHTCLTKRGTSLVRRGPDDERSSAAWVLDATHASVVADMSTAAAPPTATAVATLVASASWRATRGCATILLSLVSG